MKEYEIRCIDGMLAEKAFRALGAIIDETTRKALDAVDRNGCCGLTISPLDGRCQTSPLVDVGWSDPCARKESMELKFRDVLDDIDGVIFNEPATIVTFKDGTKVCVKACEKDTFSKEAGLMYAIVKRIYANDIGNNGYLMSKGLGAKINKVIEGAFDQKKADAEKRAKLREKAKRRDAAKYARWLADAGEENRAEDEAK